mmetsp:Transcript_46399/g.88583  ORF Transcript_46399/g.88583 Transcript_46399/m.88583 type:complete len:238 (-) Transcript_46399:548-1261(-)
MPRGHNKYELVHRLRRIVHHLARLLVHEQAVLHHHFQSFALHEAAVLDARLLELVAGHGIQIQLRPVPVVQPFEKRPVCGALEPRHEVWHQVAAVPVFWISGFDPLVGMENHDVVPSVAVERLVPNKGFDLQPHRLAKFATALLQLDVVDVRRRAHVAAVRTVDGLLARPHGPASQPAALARGLPAQRVDVLVLLLESVGIHHLVQQRRKAGRVRPIHRQRARLECRGRRLTLLNPP